MSHLLRRDFLRLLGGGAVAGSVAGAFGAGASADRLPNVIFILADDLGWGDLRCYGNQRIKTPNLDRLARQGTLFTQFYVNGSVCSPSRTAFMTGQYPARHRIHGHLATAQQNRDRGMPNWLDASAPTVPRLLQQAGYATAHFGKWHLGQGAGAPEPSAYGFDLSRTVNANGPQLEAPGEPEYFRARSTEAMVDEAIRFIEGNRERPFYVNLWTLVPHATLHPTPEQFKDYPNGPGGVPYKSAYQIFNASVTDLDRQIGRLLARLDDLGLSENTLILFSSDNGPEDIAIGNASHSGVGSAGPFRGRKRSLYEGGVRTPFIVRWPGKTPAGRVEDKAVVTGVDFLPTLCRVAGVEPPKGPNFDGEDVSDILRGQSRARTRPIHWEWRFRIMGHVWHWSPILAIREGDWKFLMNPDRSRIELYRIPDDPMEINNLADRNPDVVARLSKQVLEWQASLPKGPIEPAAGKNNYPWPDEKEIGAAN